MPLRNDSVLMGLGAVKPREDPSDLWKSFKGGLQEIPGTLTSLADMPFSGTFGVRPISAATDWIGEKTGLLQFSKWAKENQQSHSPEYYAQQREIDAVYDQNVRKDEGFMQQVMDVIQATPELATAYASNPKYTLNLVANSLPGMLVGGAGGRGLMAFGKQAAKQIPLRGAQGVAGQSVGALERAVGTRWASPIAAGAGEGTIAAGQNMNQVMEALGPDATPEQIRMATATSIGAGAFDMLIAAGGGRIAQRMGLETPETLMAGGQRVGVRRAFAPRVIGGALSEGIMQELPQSIQEGGFQNVGEGRSFTDSGPDGQGLVRQGVEGMLAGMVMGGGANVISGRGRTFEGEVTAEEISNQATATALARSEAADLLKAERERFPDYTGSGELDLEGGAGANRLGAAGVGPSRPVGALPGEAAAYNERAIRERQRRAGVYQSIIVSSSTSPEQKAQAQEALTKLGFDPRAMPDMSTMQASPQGELFPRGTPQAALNARGEGVQQNLPLEADVDTSGVVNPYEVGQRGAVAPGQVQGTAEDMFSGERRPVTNQPAPPSAAGDFVQAAAQGDTKAMWEIGLQAAESIGETDEFYRLFGQLSNPMDEGGQQQLFNPNREQAIEQMHALVQKAEKENSWLSDIESPSRATLPVRQEPMSEGTRKGQFTKAMGGKENVALLDRLKAEGTAVMESAKAKLAVLRKSKKKGAKELADQTQTLLAMLGKQYDEALKKKHFGRLIALQKQVELEDAKTGEAIEGMTTELPSAPAIDTAERRERSEKAVVLWRNGAMTDKQIDQVFKHLRRGEMKEADQIIGPAIKARARAAADKAAKLHLDTANMRAEEVDALLKAADRDTVRAHVQTIMEEAARGNGKEVRYALAMLMNIARYRYSDREAQLKKDLETGMIDSMQTVEDAELAIERLKNDKVVSFSDLIAAQNRTHRMDESQGEDVAGFTKGTDNAVKSFLANIPKDDADVGVSALKRAIAVARMIGSETIGPLHSILRKIEITLDAKPANQLRSFLTIIAEELGLSKVGVVKTVQARIMAALQEDVRSQHPMRVLNRAAQRLNSEKGGEFEDEFSTDTEIVANKESGQEETKVTRKAVDKLIRDVLGELRLYEQRRKEMVPEEQNLQMTEMAARYGEDVIEIVLRYMDISPMVRHARSTFTSADYLISGNVKSENVSGRKSLLSPERQKANAAVAGLMLDLDKQSGNPDIVTRRQDLKEKLRTLYDSAALRGEGKYRMPFADFVITLLSNPPGTKIYHGTSRAGIQANHDAMVLRRDLLDTSPTAGASVGDRVIARRAKNIEAYGKEKETAAKKSAAAGRAAGTVVETSPAAAQAERKTRSGQGQTGITDSDGNVTEFKVEGTAAEDGAGIHIIDLTVSNLENPDDQLASELTDTMNDKPAATVLAALRKAGIKGADIDALVNQIEGIRAKQLAETKAARDTSTDTTLAVGDTRLEKDTGKWIKTVLAMWVEGSSLWDYTTPAETRVLNWLGGKDSQHTIGRARLNAKELGVTPTSNVAETVIRNLLVALEALAESKRRTYEADKARGTASNLPASAADERAAARATEQRRTPEPSRTAVGTGGQAPSTLLGRSAGEARQATGTAMAAQRAAQSERTEEAAQDRDPDELAAQIWVDGLDETPSVTEARAVAKSLGLPLKNGLSADNIVTRIKARLRLLARERLGKVKRVPVREQDRTTRGGGVVRGRTGGVTQTRARGAAVEAARVKEENARKAEERRATADERNAARLTERSHMAALRRAVKIARSLKTKSIGPLAEVVAGIKAKLAGMTTERRRVVLINIAGLMGTHKTGTLTEIQREIMGKLQEPTPKTTADSVSLGPTPNPVFYAAIRKAKTVGEAVRIALALSGTSLSQRLALRHLVNLPDMAQMPLSRGDDAALRKFVVGGSYQMQLRDTGEDSDIVRRTEEVGEKINLNSISSVGVLIHEMAHAATMIGVAEHLNWDDKTNVFTAVTKLGQELIDLHALARKQMPLGGLVHYGLTDPLEMLAEVRANPVFQKAMKAIPLEGGKINLLQAVLNWFRKLLGIPASGRTAFDAAMDLTATFEAATPAARGRQTRLYNTIPSVAFSHVAYMPQQLQAAYTPVLSQVKAAFNGAVRVFSPMADIFEAMQRIGLKSVSLFKKVYERRESMMRQWQEKAERIGQSFQKIRYNDPNGSQDRKGIEALLAASTKKGWGYQPTWLKDDNGKAITVPINEEIKAQWDALSNPDGSRSEAQGIIDNVFAFNNEMWVAKNNLFNETLKASFEEERAAAEGDEKKLKDIAEREKSDTAQYGKKLARMLDKPYTPLKRFGKHAVVGKSAKFEALETKYNEDSTLSREQKQELASQLREMKASPEHYEVQFRDWALTRDRIADEMRGRFPKVYTLERTALAEQQYYELPYHVLTRLKAEIADLDVNKDTTNALQRAASTLYIEMLSQANTRKNELERLNVAGHGEMMQAFVAQAKSDASLVSSLQNNRDVLGAMREMKKEVDRGSSDEQRQERSELYNEVVKRYLNLSHYDDSTWQQKVMRGNSVMLLISSPMYLMQNATQVYMMTLPKLASRYGWFRAAALISKTYTTLGIENTLVGDTVNLDKITKLYGKDVARAISEIEIAGKLNITLMQELGQWVSKGLVPKTVLGRWIEENKITAATGRGLSFAAALPQRVEMMNRVVTAISSYQLKKADLSGRAKPADMSAEEFEAQTHDNAVIYASKIIDESQGAYNEAGSGRIFQSGNAPGLPIKLLLQFRRFQIIQLSFMLRDFKRAYGRTKPENLTEAEWTEEKAVAKRALAFAIAHYGVMTGAMGLPFVSMVAGAFAALAGDDDDELRPSLLAATPFGTSEDRQLTELWLRKQLGGGDLATLLTKGIPTLAGIDMTASIGAGTATYMLPYAKKGRTATETTWNVAKGMLGATSGTVDRLSRGYESMAAGDYVRGLEQALPRGASDIMQSIRESQSGKVDRSGTILTPAEDISAWQSVLSSIGMRTTADTKRNLLQQKVRLTEQHYAERRGEIGKDFIEAMRDKDMGKVAELRREWMKLVASMRKQKLAAPSPSALYQFWRRELRDQRQVIGGVVTKRSTRRLALEGV